MIKAFLHRFPFLFGLVFGATVFCGVYIPVVKFIGPEFSGIRGQSMFPALRDGGKCIFYTKFNEINRGDIVSFYGLGRFLCKRVVGLPGDTIIIVGDSVIINEKEYDEYYIAQRWGTKEMRTYQVPQGQYFMMGDNRTISYDSRYFGCVPREHIISKLLCNWSW